MILYVQWMPDSSCDVTGTEHHYHQTRVCSYSKQVSAWLNLVTVTHAGRLRRGSISFRGWLYSHHVERKYSTKANRAADIAAAPYTSYPVNKQQALSTIFDQFYLSGWNLPPPPTFPSKIIFKILFLLNFLSIYTPLEKAGHPWVTLNSIPPAEFNGCKIRTLLSNVSELSEPASGFPPCLPPAVSKHLQWQVTGKLILCYWEADKLLIYNWN